MLGYRRMACSVPFLVRLRLSRVTQASEKGTQLVLNMLHVFIRIMRHLVVNTMVRLSPRLSVAARGRLSL